MKRKLLLAIIVLLAGVCESLGDSSTSRLGLTKPSIGSAGWAQKTNANWDVLDSSVAVQGRTNVFLGTNTFSNPIYLNGTVSVATTSTASPLTVNGLVQSLTGGFKFPDGSIQAAAAAGPAIGNAVSGSVSNRVLFTDSTGKLQNHTDLRYSTATSYLSLTNGAVLVGTTTPFSVGSGIGPSDGYHLNVDGGSVFRANSGLGGMDMQFLDSSNNGQAEIWLDDTTHDFQVLASSSLVIGTNGGGQMKVVGNGGGHDVLQIGGAGGDNAYLMSIVEPAGGPLAFIITDDPVAENSGIDLVGSGSFDMWSPTGYFGGGGSGELGLAADDSLNPTRPKIVFTATHASQSWTLSAAYADGTFSILDGSTPKLSIKPGGRVALPTYTPATSGASCTTGELAWDASFVYVCTATNTWKRAAIATW